MKSPPGGSIRRPLPVTAVGAVFVAFGCVALPLSMLRILDEAGLAGLADRFAREPLDVGLAAAARALAVVGGVFLLRGVNWARYVIVAWLAYYVAISLLHEPTQVAIHGGLLAIVAYLLFRRDAREYFRPRTAVSP